MGRPPCGGSLLDADGDVMQTAPAGGGGDQLRRPDPPPRWASMASRVSSDTVEPRRSASASGRSRASRSSGTLTVVRFMYASRPFNVGWAWTFRRLPSPLAMCYRVDTMSHSVGIRELRQQASAVLRRVVGGESIDVTDHGHPIARIVPLRPGVLDQLVIEGRATVAAGDLLDLADELGLPASGPASPSAALAELRADER
jgi:prevent-host-death family protein